MDGVTDNTGVITDFPFESVRKPRVPLIDTGAAPEFTAKSYDNRADLSALVSSLNSTLDGFKETLAASSFFSRNFSWLTMTAKTSNPGVAKPIAREDAEANVWILETDTLARTRTHTSVVMASGDRSEFTTAAYGFDLTVNGTVYPVSYGVVNEDTAPLTNHAMLRDLATAVNGSGAGVNASVGQAYRVVPESYYGDAAGLEHYVHLDVAAEKSGSGQTFSFRDTSGELISALGLGRTRTFGRDSEYRVDGEPFEFYSTIVNIGGTAVQAYLTGQSGVAGAVAGADRNGLARIETRPGFEAAAGHVVSVIGAYNDMISWIDENEYFISKSLKTELFSSFDADIPGTRTVEFSRNMDKTFAVVKGEVKIYEDSGISPRLTNTGNQTLRSRLEAIGLSLKTDGTLDIGSGFEAGFRSNFRHIHDTLSGDTGFFTRINEALDKIRASDDDRYVYTANHVLVYTADAGAAAKKIYQQNVSTLINTFA